MGRKNRDMAKDHPPPSPRNGVFYLNIVMVKCYQARRNEKITKYIHFKFIIRIILDTPIIVSPRTRVTE